MEALGVQKGLHSSRNYIYIQYSSTDPSHVPVYVYISFARVFAKIVCPQTPSLVAEKGKDSV
jgi:hypothetical protein